MEFRQPGNSGLKISIIGLGSMTFGGRLPAWESRQVLDKFQQEGGNFIDTASGYNRGEAESIIGQWMADGKHRPYMIICTKTFLPESGDLNHRGLSRHAILYSVEQSLRRLQTDYIDIYCTHYWDWQTPMEETLYTLEMLVKQGKVRYVACSNYLGWQLAKAQDFQKQSHMSPFIALQAQYHLLERGLEREIMSLLRHEKLGLLAWSGLAGGFLTGKYTPDREPPEGTRLDVSAYYRRQSYHERGWKILRVVQSLAEKYGATPAQISLAWVLSNPVVSSVLTGVSYISQIDSNIEAFRLQLEAEDTALLDKVSAFEKGYPANLVEFDI